MKPIEPARPTQPIIGLAGRKGSGKTTTARAMAVLAEPGEVATIMSFAEPIKCMCFALSTYLNLPFGEAERLIRGDGKEDPQYYFGGKTWRVFQQLLGKELARDGLHPDMWIRIAEMVMRRHGHERATIFDDVRFPNEAEFIRSRGGVVLRIVDHKQPPSDDTHASETSLPSECIDGVVHIDKSRPPEDAAHLALEAAEWFLSRSLRGQV